MVNNHPDMRPGTIVDPGARSGVWTMNASVRILMAAIAAGSAALPLPALSADYDPPIVVDQPVEEVPIEVGSGWYLRGDIGYNFQVDADGDFDYRTFDALTGVYSDNTFATGIAQQAGHLERRRRLQFHRHAPRRRDGRRLPHELRRHDGKCRALRRPCGVPRLCRDGLPLRGLRRPLPQSASWPTAMSISAPMSA